MSFNFLFNQMDTSLKRCIKTENDIPRRSSTKVLKNVTKMLNDCEIKELFKRM